MEEVDLIPSLPVGVSVGLVKNKTNLKEKIKNFFSELFKESPRYRIVKYDNRYCPQVKIFGVWHWIQALENCREDLFYDHMYVGHITIEFARKKIDDHKAKKEYERAGKRIKKIEVIETR